MNSELSLFSIRNTYMNLENRIFSKTITFYTIISSFCDPVEWPKTPRSSSSMALTKSDTSCFQPKYLFCPTDKQFFIPSPTLRTCTLSTVQRIYTVSRYFPENYAAARYFSSSSPQLCQHQGKPKRKDSIQQTFVQCEAPTLKVKPPLTSFLTSRWSVAMIWELRHCT